MRTETVKVGDLAYYKSITGAMVPCKILSIDSEGKVTFRVTASRSYYRKGDVEEMPSGLWIHSRKAVKIGARGVQVLARTIKVPETERV